jgi:hypothetical protein
MMSMLRTTCSCYCQNYHKMVCKKKPVAFTSLAIPTDNLLNLWVLPQNNLLDLAHSTS